MLLGRTIKVSSSFILNTGEDCPSRHAGNQLPFRFFFFFFSQEITKEKIPRRKGNLYTQMVTVKKTPPKARSRIPSHPCFAYTCYVPFLIHVLSGLSTNWHSSMLGMLQQLQEASTSRLSVIDSLNNYYSFFFHSFYFFFSFFLRNSSSVPLGKKK